MILYFWVVRDLKTSTLLTQLCSCFISISICHFPAAHRALNLPKAAVLNNQKLCCGWTTACGGEKEESSLKLDWKLVLCVLQSAVFFRRAHGLFSDADFCLPPNCI